MIIGLVPVIPLMVLLGYVLELTFSSAGWGFKGLGFIISGLFGVGVWVLGCYLDIKESKRYGI